MGALKETIAIAATAAIAAIACIFQKNVFAFVGHPSFEPQSFWRFERVLTTKYLKSTCEELTLESGNET